jgi:hypothetical protein
VENAIIWGSVLLEMIATALSAAGFSDPAIGLSNESNGLLFIGLAIIWIYAAYWAFDIRRALSTNLFRNQALGMGLVAIGWLLVNTAYSYGGTTGIAIGATGIALVLALYWIDSSIFAAQRTDPMQRNTMMWREVRWLVWPAFGALFALTLLIQFAPPLSAWQPVWLGTLGLPSFLIPVVILAAVFAKSVMRSKDRTLRKHLRWFGLSFVGLFVTLFTTSLIVTGLGGTVSDATTVPAFTVFAYCIYRSAKSLAPLERMDRSATGGSRSGQEGSASEARSS